MGLCADCRFMRQIKSDRGSIFYCASGLQRTRGFPNIRACRCCNARAMRRLDVGLERTTGRDGRHCADWEFAARFLRSSSRVVRVGMKRNGHATENSWHHRDHNVFRLSGCRAPGLEQERTYRSYDRRGFHVVFGVARLGCANTVWNGTLRSGLLNPPEKQRHAECVCGSGQAAYR